MICQSSLEVRLNEIVAPVYIHGNIIISVSELLMIKARKLMKVVAIKSRVTVQLTETELFKAYLHGAVLYYTTGQYQTAIDHCTLVMRSQDH